MPKTPILRAAQGAAHRVASLLVDAVMVARAMDVVTEEPATTADAARRAPASGTKGGAR